MFAVMLLHRRLNRCMLAVGLTALYALGLGSSLLHRLVVQHLPCADHGEWTHLRGATVDVVETILVAAPAADDAGDADAGDADDGDADDGDAQHEHEHCLLAGFAFSAVLHEAVEAAIAPPWPPVRAGSVPATAPVESSFVEGARYRLAPKGSPPVRA